MDRLAECWLRQAERLTNNLQVAAFAEALHVVNVAGRQRMLSQKLAKEALLAALLPGRVPAYGPDRVATSRSDFAQGMTYLQSVPLRTPAIDGQLEAARMAWAAFQAVLDDVETGDRLSHLASLSEELLTHFSRLTDAYEAGVYALLTVEVNNANTA